jgi:hypothetical protein
LLPTGHNWTIQAQFSPFLKGGFKGDFSTYSIPLKSPLTPLYKRGKSFVEVS